MPNEPIGNQPPRTFTLSGLFVLTAVVVLLLSLTFPAVRYARDSARRMQCQYNLRVIGIATHNYLDAYRCFPPVYAMDYAGRPTYSWRVCVCPFIEASLIPAKFDFRLAWDHPYNRQVVSWRWRRYECPVDKTRGNAETNYTMIVGPGLFADGRSTAEPDTIGDGLSNTIMYVETIGAKLRWAAPGDLEAERISFGINKPPMPGIASEHPGGANCTFCDGSVGFLANSIEPSQMRAMCTIRGGEKTDADRIPRVDPKYPNARDR